MRNGKYGLRKSEMVNMRLRKSEMVNMDLVNEKW